MPRDLAEGLGSLAELGRHAVRPVAVRARALGKGRGCFRPLIEEAHDIPG